MIVCNEDGTPKLGPDGKAVIVRCTIHDLDLQEFSAVDFPAHEGARAAIQKRHSIISTESPKETQIMTTPDLASVQADLSKAQAALTAATAEKAELQKQLTFLGRVAQLTDAERAHLASVDESERSTWVGKSRALRQADIDAALAADPVEVTLPNGTQVRKSAGSLAIELAKQNKLLWDNQMEQRSENDRLRLEKRASTELGNVAGSSGGKVALLKAVEGIADEAVRKEAAAVLKAANDGMKQVFKVFGADGVTEAEADAFDVIMKKAEKYAQDKKVPVAKAFSIITDPAHEDCDPAAIAAYDQHDADRRGNQR